MSNYIYTNDGLVNADELTHYGVPGMRWGVRRAMKYSSAERIQKLRNRITKYENKSKKYTKKFEKHIHKGRDTAGNKLIRSRGSIKANARKASREYFKANRFAKKAEKIKLRIEKESQYVAQMKKTIRSIPKKDLDNGYAFCKELLRFGK